MFFSTQLYRQITAVEHTEASEPLTAEKLLELQAMLPPVPPRPWFTAELPPLSFEE